MVMLKIALFAVLLTAEIIYLPDFVGLILLTVFFGTILLWNTIYCLRYLIFLLLSALLLIPTAWILHEHFYNWQNVARKQILKTTANTLEELNKVAGRDAVKLAVELFSEQSKSQYERYRFEIDDVGAEGKKTNSKQDGMDMASLSVSSKGGGVRIIYERNIRPYWEWDWQWPLDWDGTYFRYWRALLTGEVFFSHPGKYRDVFMLHIITLLAVIILYLQLNFRRNYLRSQSLLDRLNMILAEKG
jgi:hypothetical protein